MSESDEDLFGSGDEGTGMDVIKNETAGDEKSGESQIGEDSDDDLFGEAEAGSSSSRVDADRDGGDLDEPRLDTEEEKLTAILGVNQTSKARAGQQALHVRARTQSKLYLPPVVSIPETTEKIYVKMPKVLKIQSDAYSADTYDAEAEQMEYNNSSIISDVIRWRIKRDAKGEAMLHPDGRFVKESNARLQKMKNGTFRLVVGTAVFACPTEQLAKSYIFSTAQSNPPEDAVLTEAEETAGVTMNRATNLVCSADMNGSLKMTVRVDDTGDNTAVAQRLSQKVKSMFKKENRMGVEDSRQLVEKPEVVAARLQKAEEARNRATRKAREVGDGVHADGGRGSSYGRISMSSDYLNANAEDQYDSYNIGDIKKGKRESEDRKPAARKASKAVKNEKSSSRRDDGSDQGAFSDDVDEEDEDEDEDEEDSDDADDDDADLEGFIAKGGEGSSGEDEEDAIAVQKTKHFKKGNKPVKSKSSKAKGDGSDDDGSDIFSDASEDEDEEDAVQPVKRSAAEGNDEEAAPVKKRARRAILDSDEDE